MKIFPIVLILALSCTSLEGRRGRNRNAKSENSREGKLFSLFSVVNFSNGVCSSSISGSGNSVNRIGTCYTMDECVNTFKGTAGGNCASGFGVCCLTQITAAAGGTINTQTGFMQNPGYPSVYTLTDTVTYTVQKVYTDVCTLRLDFDTFNLVGNADALEVGGGACIDDVLTITPAGQAPPICGINTGQHMFLEFGTATADTIVLTFTFPAATEVMTRTWDIRAEQIKCSETDLRRPPSGCLQYYTELTGQIKTFNYDAMDQSHLADQDYNVCIRPTTGFCCVQYAPCAGDAMAYTLYSEVSGTALPIAMCTTDYITIPGASSMCFVGGDLAPQQKFCGEKLHTVATSTTDGPVCSCEQPFMVRIVTDNTVGATETTSQKGLCLTYTQLACR